MKKLLQLSSFCVFIFSAHLSAQQFQNGHLDEWENVGTATEEPENWSSLKTADALASSAPQVLFRDAGRLGGYAVRLEVKSVFGIPANGIITNGRVHADFNPENGYVYTEPMDPQWHTLFTHRPDSLVGWLKYAPQSGDKGKVEVILHTNEGRLPFNGYEQNLVARARYDITQASSDWMRFSVPFQYFAAGNPEFILATVAAGDSTIAKNGTLLWIDDLELIYNDPTVGTSDQLIQDYRVYFFSQQIHFPAHFVGNYEVIDALGRTIQSGAVLPSVPFSQGVGIYVVRLRDVDGSLVWDRRLYSGD